MTIKNNKITSKTSVVLFSSIVLTLMISFIGTNTAYAHHTDYVEQIVTKFDEHEKLHPVVIDYQQQIDSIDQKIKESSNESFETSQLEEEKEYLEMLITIHENRMTQLFNAIETLEQKNIASFKVDESTEKQLHSAEKLVIDQYWTPELKNNLVLDIAVDYRHQKIVIFLDEDLIGQYPQVLTSLNSDSQKVPLDIRITKFTDSSCTSRTSECDPVIGGISIAEKDDNSLNTLGYKAVRNSVTGFVIAGHTVTAVNDEVVQAHNQNNNEIGTVLDRFVQGGDGDFAFVDLDENERDINDDIYRTGSTVYDISGKTDRSNQIEGETVWKSGAASGLTVGDIDLISSVTERIIVDAYSEGGDSGSPVFKVVDENAVLYGILTGQTGGDYFYYAHDTVEAEIDAIASTS